MSFQDKVQQHISSIDSQLSKYPQLQHLERQAGVPKVYAVLAVAVVYGFFVFMNWGGQLLSNLVGFALPTYYSMVAIESTGTKDDTQWLTYWVVYGFFSVIEYWSNTLLYFIPFWYLLKTSFLLWLALPNFRGAEVVYAHVLKPTIGKYVKPSASDQARAQFSAGAKTE